MREFMASRRNVASSRSKVAITFHSAGKQILWPYGYTATDVPADMTVEDHAALVAMGKAMAARNGYTPMQSSSLHVTDGDEISTGRRQPANLDVHDGAVPIACAGELDPVVDPPDEKIGPETLRNKDAIFYLIERAWCRWAVIGKTTQNCGPLFEDFNIPRHGPSNPLGTDTAPTGAWQRGTVVTTRQAGPLPRGRAGSITGAAAGASAQQLRRRRDHVDPWPAGPARLDDRQPDVPRRLRPRLELVVGRLLPRVCRARGRQPDDRAPGGRGREQRQPGVVVVEHVARAVGRREDPDRLEVADPSPVARSRRPWTTSGSRGRSRGEPSVGSST